MRRLPAFSETRLTSRDLERCLAQKVQMHTKPNRHTKKVHEMEHKRHFTKSPFHMAFYLSKDSSESEMSNKAKGKLCLNGKQQKINWRRRL